MKLDMKVTLKSNARYNNVIERKMNVLRESMPFQCRP